MPKQKKFTFLLLILVKYLYMTIPVSEAPSDSALKKATCYVSSLHYSTVEQGWLTLGDYCYSSMKAKKDPRNTLRHPMRKNALWFSRPDFSARPAVTLLFSFFISDCDYRPPGTLADSSPCYLCEYSHQDAHTLLLLLLLLYSLLLEFSLLLSPSLCRKGI